MGVGAAEDGHLGGLDEDEDEDEAEDEKEDEDDDDDDEEDGWLVMMGEIYGPRSLNECARRPCDRVLVC